MPKASKGFRCRTRGVLRVKPSAAGKVSTSRRFLNLEEGERAAVVISPGIHAGMPHPKFQGLTGVVAGHQGRSYLLRVSDGGNEKVLVVGPEHLRKI